MDYYKCEKCDKMFDEFEMNYRESQIDKRVLCEKCRIILNAPVAEKLRHKSSKFV